MSALSSAKLAGQFVEVLQDEAGSMKAEKSIRCVLHQQDELGKFQHHQKLFGFPFLQGSCPGEAELVVSLFKALQSKARPKVQFFSALGGGVITTWVGNLSPQSIACLICFLQGA
jgi:hypothetical protein